MVKHKVWITEDCIGCAACSRTYEVNFKMNDEDTKALVKKDIIDDKELSGNEEAKEVCPVEAIKIERFKDKH